MQFLTTTTESYISLFFTLALMLVLYDLSSPEEAGEEGCCHACSSGDR